MVGGFSDRKKSKVTTPPIPLPFYLAEMHHGQDANLMMFAEGMECNWDSLNAITTQAGAQIRHMLRQFCGSNGPGGSSDDPNRPYEASELYPSSDPRNPWIDGSSPVLPHWTESTEMCANAITRQAGAQTRHMLRQFCGSNGPGVSSDDRPYTTSNLYPFSDSRNPWIDGTSPVLPHWTEFTETCATAGMCTPEHPDGRDPFHPPFTPAGFRAAGINDARMLRRETDYTGAFRMVNDMNRWFIAASETIPPILVRGEFINRFYEALETAKVQRCKTMLPVDESLNRWLCIRR